MQWPMTRAGNAWCSFLQSDLLRLAPESIALAYAVLTGFPLSVQNSGAFLRLNGTTYRIVEITWVPQHNEVNARVELL